MIYESDVVFVTTTLYSKWLSYQNTIIRNLFPSSQHILVDGRQNWPNSWFLWIEETKKTDKKFYIHLDEDFFITSKEEVLKLLQKMENENIDLCGCPDGYHQYRGANPVALNTFFMIGRVDDLKKITVNLSETEFFLKQNEKGIFTWGNNLDMSFKQKYANDFDYKFTIQGEHNFGVDQEPYYAFLWYMKELRCKFEYLFPYFDERFKSTNPRIEEDSKDIGIHMWYVRQWSSEMDVWGEKNIERYKKLEEEILKK
jgi:hypothetical protein